MDHIEKYEGHSRAVRNMKGVAFLVAKHGRRDIIPRISEVTNW